MADAPAHPAHPGGTINIAGHKVKKSTALLGGVAGVGVIIYAMWRKQQAAAASTQATAALVTDPAGNQCATLDPATGYCPGSAADIAAQQATAAGLSSASGGGLSGDGYYYTPPAGTGTSGTGSAVPAFADNASWGQYVETALGSNGSDSIAAAIAKYLSGQPVTVDQQTTIEEAIALANYPPVTGPNGDPPSMTLLSSSGTGTGTGTGTGDGTGTGSGDGTGTGSGSGSGSGTGTAGGTSTVSGGHVVSVNNNDVVIAWTAAGPAKQWRVVTTGPGPQNGRSGIVGTPKASYSGLEAKHNYEFTVTPWAGGKAAGPSGAPIHAMTT
jgi:hypothetical protein